MAYDDIKSGMGKEPVYLIEMYLDRCENVFGVAPCTATAGTGLKCFQSIHTCLDLPNYALPAVGAGENPLTSGKKVYRFSNRRLPGFEYSSSDPEGDAPVFPTVRSVDMSASKLEPGRGLGVRSGVKVNLTDHPWSDIGVDPYLDERLYNPENQGSFWGRLIARNPHYVNRYLIVKVGYLENGEFIEDNFQTRAYVISKIAGPNAKGEVTISGRDMMRFADAERKQFPPQATAELDGALNNSDTSFNITDDDGVIAAQIDAGQDWIRVNDEIMQVGSYTNNGGGSYTLSGVTRGTMPSSYIESSEASSHEDGASVQECYYFNNVAVETVVYTLLNTGAGIDSFFLPLADWQTLISDRGYTNYTFTRLLIEPSGVKKYLEEISEHNIIMWWHEREQEFQIDVLTPQIVTAGPFQDDTDVIQDSFSHKRDDDERVTAVRVMYGHRSPLLDSDRDIYFYGGVTQADADAQTDEEFGDVRFRNVPSLWLTSSQKSVAGEIASRLLINYRDVKDVITFEMEAKDDELWTGDSFLMTTRFVQTIYGESKSQAYRTLGVKEVLNAEKIRYKYTAESQVSSLRSGLITPDEDPDEPGVDFPDYSDSNSTLKFNYGYIGYDDGGRPGGTSSSPTAQDFPDLTEPYEVI